MTAIAAWVEPSFLAVAMDTLVRDASDGSPKSFTSKLLPLVHLRSLVCGTGVHEFILGWYFTIQAEAGLSGDIRSIENLGDTLLASGWRPYPGLTAEGSTIYHFGFDEAAGRFRAFYRKSPEFRSVEVDSGMILKPPVAIRDEWSSPAALPDVVKAQRLFDQSQPPNAQVGVGGEVQLAVLTSSSIHIQICHRFEDYDAIVSQFTSRSQPSE